MLPYKLVVKALACLVVGLSSRVASADLLFPDFASTTGLNLVGASASVDNRLRLTPATPNASGGAWAIAKQPIQGGFQTS
jgi:hypothetical protein